MPIMITGNSIILYGGIRDPFTPTTNPGGPQGPTQPQYRENTQFGPLDLIRGVIATGESPYAGNPAPGNVQHTSFQATPQGWAIGPGYIWATEYAHGVGDEPYEEANIRIYQFAGLTGNSNPAGYGSDGMHYMPIAATPGATVTVIGSTYGSNAPQGGFGTGTSSVNAYMAKAGSSTFYPYYNPNFAPRSGQWYKVPLSLTDGAPVSTSNIISTYLPQPVTYTGGKRSGSAPDKLHAIKTFSNTVVPITSTMPSPSYSPQITYTTFPFASEIATQLATNISLPQWVSAAAPASNGWYYRSSGAWNFYSEGDNSIHMGGGSAVRSTVWGQGGFVKYPTASVNSVSVAAQLGPQHKTPDGRGMYESGVGQDVGGGNIFAGGGTYAPSPPSTGTNQWAIVKYSTASNTTINAPVFTSYRPLAPTPVTFPGSSTSSTMLPHGSPSHIVSGGDSKLYMGGGYNTFSGGQIRIVPTITPYASFVNTYAQVPTPLIRRNMGMFGV